MNPILRGDLKFSLGVAESWGPLSRMDNSIQFFSHKLSIYQLIDISLMRLKPTHSNQSVGEDHVAKRLDWFFCG